MTERPLKFYLDETGSTGDAVQTSTTSAFGDQPTFVLAATGEADGSKSLDVIVAGLIRHHRVQAEELKGVQQIKRRPRLVLDLVERLLDDNHPVFAEIMDKRYYVIGNLVSFFLLSTMNRLVEVGNETFTRLMIGDNGFFIWRRELADVLYDVLGDDVLRAYSAAGVSRSVRDLWAFATAFAQQVDQAFASSATGSRKEMLQQVGELGIYATMSIQAAVKALESRGGDEGDVVDLFLPPPDLSRGGSRIAMLPNVAALNHIRGAINAYAGPTAVIVHDEHGAYDIVLKDTDALLTSNLFAFRDETLENVSLPFVAPVSYSFEDAPPLRFARSEDSSGIQASDLVASLLRHYVDTLTRGAEPEPELVDAVRLLWSATPQGSVALNVVTSTGQLQRTFGPESPLSLDSDERPPTTCDTKL